MLEKLKNIVKRFFLKKIDVLSSNDILINNKSILVGKRSIIEKLNISIQTEQSEDAMVIIGDDCIIEGQIVIYSRKGKIKIGDRVFIGPNTTLFCYDNISIQDDVLISWGCTLIDTNAHSIVSTKRLTDVLDWKKGNYSKNWDNVISKPISIESNSWIGFNTIVMKGVIIKKSSVIAAGSVVTKSTKPYSIYGGNPAQFLKSTS